MPSVRLLTHIVANTYRKPWSAHVQSMPMIAHFTLFDRHLHRPIPHNTSQYERVCAFGVGVYRLTAKYFYSSQTTTSFSFSLLCLQPFPLPQAGPHTLKYASAILVIPAIVTQRPSRAAIRPSRDRIGLGHLFHKPFAVPQQQSCVGLVSPKGI